MSVSITFLFFSLALLSWPVAGQKAQPPQVVEKEIQSFFLQEFSSGLFGQISSEDIGLRFIHTPHIPPIESGLMRLEIESQRKLPRLGFQTVWVTLFRGPYAVEKLPVTLEVSVYRNVVIAHRKLGRGEQISPDKIRVVRKRLVRGYEDVIEDPAQVCGLVTRHLVRAGSILTASAVESPPVVGRGDRVQVEMVMGNTVISTKGIARQEGSIGDKIQLVCEATGKRLTGIIRSPGLVLIE